MVFDGDKLKKIRKKIGYSQKAMAKEIGCTAVTISNWESGVSFPNSQKAATLIVLLQKYGYSIDSLYNLSEEDKILERRHKRKTGSVLDPMKLKNKREQIGMLQRELAYKLGVNPYTVSKWELGTTGCSTKNINAIANILGCKQEDITKKEE